MSVVQVELLPGAIQGLPLSSLAAVERACRTWRRDVDDAAPSHPEWRTRACGLLPYADAWLSWAPAPTDGFVQAARSINDLRRRLQSLWTAEYREGFRFFKHSRWVTSMDDPEFILRIVFALRMFYLSAPRAYFTLDGAPGRQCTVRTTPYDCSHWPWWEITPQRLCDPPQRVSKHAFLALTVLEESVVPYKRNDEHIVRALEWWWGGEDRSVLAELFDVEAFLALAAFIVDSCAGEESDDVTWQPWTEGDDFEVSLEAVFGDVENLTRHSIESCAASAFSEFPDLASEFDPDDEMHDRQIPPMFNFIKLVEHVELQRRI